MDASRFDALTRALSVSSRRGLLGLLLTLPGLGGLLAFLAPEEAAAKKRHKNRRRRHKHGQGRPKNRRKKNDKKKPCRAKSRAKICAGRCGVIKNGKTCKKKINCGSCACDPACDVCFTCEEGPNTPGVCVVDAAQQGQDCGEPGQVCQADGECVCDADSCSGTAPICVDGVCVACSDAQSCPSGCCAGDGSCLAGNTEDFCGVVGATCQACGSGQLCVDGACKVCLIGACEPGNTSGCQYATLQEAIDDPAGPETLSLCARTYQERIIVTRSLTLDGAGQGVDGTVLNGDGSGPVVIVGAAVPDVFLENLRITGGVNDGGNGGGVSNNGSVTLTDCTVANNEADVGGGIYNNESGLTLNGCTVTNNEAINGGGIRNFRGEMSITDTSVTLNTAINGGGIFNGGGVNDPETGTITFSGDSSVSNNTGGNCNGEGSYVDPVGACAP